VTTAAKLVQLMPMRLRWTQEGRWASRRVSGRAGAPAGGDDVRCSAARRRPPVVLVHGFRVLSQDSQEASLDTLEAALRRRGFASHRFAYRPRDDTVQRHAAALADFILGVPDVRRAGAVGLVSHSFGGPLIRAALNTPRWKREEAHSSVAVRCAMLAPPSRGSALARALLPTAEGGMWGSAVNVFSQTVLGTKAGLELASTDPDASDRVFGLLPDYCEALVVAGDVGQANPLLEGPSDGVVTVAETVLDSPHSHLTLTAPHNLIAVHPAAVRAVLAFLECEPVPGARHIENSRHKEGQSESE
jgi:hypothetical protein